MKKDDLEITKDKIQDGIVKFTAKGRINSMNASILQHKLEEAMQDEQFNLVLNMSQIEYLSSIGIRIILKIYKQAEDAGGKFQIERPSEIVKNILGMAALNELLAE